MNITPNDKPKKKYKYRKKCDKYGNPTGKNIVGYQPRYASGIELQEKVDEYFANCPDKRKMYFRMKDEVLEREVPNFTMGGLVLFLGFTTKQMLYRLGQDPRFKDVVDSARLRVETEYEKLLKENSIGAIFALKNMGWVDSQHVKQEVEEHLHVEYAHMPDEDIDKELKRLLEEEKLRPEDSRSSNE